jgi:hypothetical protein
VKFSKIVDYKGTPHFVCKTGRKNIRILKPGDPYEQSFVVPLKKVSNRRPAEYEPEDEDVDEVELSGEPEVELEDLQEEAFQPQ